MCSGGRASRRACGVGADVEPTASPASGRVEQRQGASARAAQLRKLNVVAHLDRRGVGPPLGSSGSGPRLAFVGESVLGSSRESVWATR